MAKSRICSVEGCGKPVAHKDMCKGHYLRVWKYGSPESRRRTKQICKIEGCSKFVKGHGFCDAHYARWKNNGDPNINKNPNLGNLFKFFKEVVMNFSGGGCLIWPYSKDGNGYGMMWADGKQVRVHRYLCEIMHGKPKQNGMYAAHLCGNGNKGCVSKYHIVWATPKVNTLHSKLHGTMICGSNHPGSKLTIDKVREIRLMFGKVMRKDIAKKYGVSESLITKIWKRQCWSWLDDE